MKVTNPIQIPAVAYIRMSTADQKESPAIQRKEILAKFGSKYNIEKWFIDEGKSGSHDKKRRTEFIKMLKEARNSTWKVILCLNRSRFTREDIIASAADKEILRNLGITVVTVEDGLLDWNTTEGRMVDGLMTETKNVYSINLGENTLKGRLNAFNNRDTGGQIVPYGFARLVKNHLGEPFVVPRLQQFQRPKHWKSDLIPGDEEEIKVLKWLFEEFATKDISLHQLAMSLNEKKIPSPRGGFWRDKVLLAVLSNIRYIGNNAFGNDSAGRFFRVENGEVTATAQNKPRVSNKKDRLIKEGTHEALIPKDLFEKVQIKIQRRKKSGQHSHGEEGKALTGVLICGKCGKPMYGNERTDPKKHRVGIKYSCKGKHRTFEDGCDQWGVHQDDILPFLCEQLGQEFQKKHAELSAPTYGLPVEDNDKEAKQKKLAKLSEQYQKGTKKLLLLDDHLFKELAKQLNALKDEIDQLQTEIERPSANGETAREWGKLCHKFTLDLGKAGFTFQPPSKLRELFHQWGVKCSLWFERITRKGNGKPGKSYKVAKIRIQSDWLTYHLDTAHFATLASESLSKCAAVDVVISGEKLINRKQKAS
jgi:site-specific DNA recombinase